MAKQKIQNQKPGKDQNKVQPARQNIRENQEQLQLDTHLLTLAPDKNELNPSNILTLQKTVGNQVVQRIISDRTLEPALRDTAQIQGYDRVALTKAVDGHDLLGKGAEGEEELAKSVAPQTAKGAEGQEELEKPGRSLPVEVSVRQLDAPATSQANQLGDHQEQLAKPNAAAHAGAPPSQALGPHYGLTYPEFVQPHFKANKKDDKWFPKVDSIFGFYSMQTVILGHQTEITGPGGNTTEANYEDQVDALIDLGIPGGNHNWYMKSAVVAHEKVHAAKFKPALETVVEKIAEEIEKVSIADAEDMDEGKAWLQLQNEAAFTTAVEAGNQTWLAEILTQVAGQHSSGGPTDQAEQAVVDPMIEKICEHAEAENWAGHETCG